MKIAKKEVSKLCRKRRKMSSRGVSQDDAVVFFWQGGKKICKKICAWNDPERERKYHRFCAGHLADCVSAEDEVSLVFVLDAFLEKRSRFYHKTDLGHIKTIMLLTLEVFPDISVSRLNGGAFRRIQSHVKEHGERAGWSVGYANKLVNFLRKILKWGFSYDLVPAEVYERIRLIPPISVRETKMEETLPVREVADDVVRKTLPFMPPVIADMVKLQRGACMRPSEVRLLKIDEISRTESNWRVYARVHKTSRTGLTRFIVFGEAETEILRRRCEGRSSEEYVFSLKAGKCLSNSSYGHAVERAVERANREGVSIPHWTPYQLRHSAVTATSIATDRETASLLAGHKSLKTTEIYDHKLEFVADREARKREEGWWDVLE